MKALYYDCFSGLSGDMNLGAMIDLGVDFNYLKTELSKLGLDKEFKITEKRADKHGIFGTKVDVIDLNEIHHDHHDHHVHHDHLEHHEHHDHHEHDHERLRDYKEIKGIIESSGLSERVKRDSIKVFHIIAEAEAKIHGKSIDDVHFHEVGAIDSIVDIVGAAICLEALDVGAVYASTVEVGSGFVKCAHGLMPIPAPATAEILTGVPIKSDVKKFEMTTPTGAAILKAFVSLYTDSKSFTAEKIGYGLGTRDMAEPNLVRVFLFEADDMQSDVEREDSQWILETNIDDMSSELLVYAEEKLFEMGALDVYKTPIIMKKGRPAIKLTILAWQKDIKAIQRAVFTETTSIGMRMYPVEKVKIVRKYEVYETSLGPISLKKAYFEDQLVNVKPEYEQIKKIALETGQSIKDVYKRIEAEIQKG